MAACMHICASCMSSARGGQKRESDPQELGLQMIVSHYVGVESGSSERAALSDEPSP